MGKMAILMILGLSFAVGIYTYIITQRSVEATENYSSYYAYTNTRNIAHSAVNIALREIELRRTSPYEGTFGLGQWRVDTTSVGDTVNMVARSWYMDASYVMYLTLRRYAKPFPEIESAVALNIDDIEFKVSGQGQIDGRDHDLNGNIVGPGLPGVTVPSPVESTTVVNEVMPPASIDGGVRSSNTMPDLSQYVEEYILNADYTYNPGTYSSITWGSATDPKIVYCNGTPSQVKFSGNVNGWGVLVVRGKIWIGGDFTFRGLIIVFGGLSVVEKDALATGAGTPNIIGAVVMAGAPGSRFEMKGNPKFVYSSEAIEKARLMAKLAAYEILDWWE
ncbi:MAG: hypothetical protein V3U68_04200 [Bacteroidota bacterium]